MIRCDSFTRAAVFAAMAAAGWLVWAVIVGPWLGARAALSLYLIVVMGLYVSALVPSRSRRIVAALAAGGAGVAVAVHAQTVGTLVLGLAVILGLVRGITLGRTSVPRVIVIEVALGAAALLFARALAGSTLLSLAVALWAYLLVHGCFFLIGGVSRRLLAVQPDPFEEAHRRAMALLDPACGDLPPLRRGRQTDRGMHPIPPG